MVEIKCIFMILEMGALRVALKCRLPVGLEYLIY